MKIPDDKFIIELYKIIGRIGSIAMQHYTNLKACIKSGIWTEEQVLEWAKHFADDPWRLQNKDYRTVAHFLRDPERWIDPKTAESEGKAWTL